MFGLFRRRRHKHTAKQSDGQLHDAAEQSPAFKKAELHIPDKRQERARAESALLTYYLQPRTMPSDYTQANWKDSLGTSYKKAVEHLVQGGYLRKPNLTEALEFARVKDIKPVLREHSLPVSGRKRELIARLIEHEPELAKKMARNYAEKVFVVTDRGRDRAQSFEKDRSARQSQARQRVRSLIEQCDLESACQTINQFYGWLPPIMRPGLGIDWQDPDGGVYLYLDRATYLLQQASTSWVAQEIPVHLRQAFIHTAIENELWSGPVDVSNLESLVQEPLKRSNVDYIRLLMSVAANALDLQSAKELGIERIGILTANDSHVCAYCQNMANQTYALTEVPILPSPHCTNAICRCWYEPLVGYSPREPWSAQPAFFASQEGLRRPPAPFGELGCNRDFEV